MLLQIIYFNSEVENITKTSDGYELKTTKGDVYKANFVVVNAELPLLFLAHKMGHGKHMGSLPMAGSLCNNKTSFKW